MNKYQTVAGDTFDLVAHKLFGDRRYTRHMYEANPDYVDVLIFAGGVALNVPEIEEPVTIAADLPPWRSAQ